MEREVCCVLTYSMHLQNHLAQDRLLYFRPIADGGCPWRETWRCGNDTNDALRGLLRLFLWYFHCSYRSASGLFSKVPYNSAALVMSLCSGIDFVFAYSPPVCLNSCYIPLPYVHVDRYWHSVVVTPLYFTIALWSHETLTLWLAPKLPSNWRRGFF